MAFIHVPESEANEMAKVFYRFVGTQAGKRVGSYVAHQTYKSIKDHLDDNGHSYHESQSKTPPFGYSLLVHKSESHA